MKAKTNNDSWNCIRIKSFLLYRTFYAIFNSISLKEKKIGWATNRKLSDFPGISLSQSNAINYMIEFTIGGRKI